MVYVGRLLAAALYWEICDELVNLFMRWLSNFTSVTVKPSLRLFSLFCITLFLLWCYCVQEHLQICELCAFLWIFCLFAAGWSSGGLYHSSCTESISDATQHWSLRSQGPKCGWIIRNWVSASSIGSPRIAKGPENSARLYHARPLWPCLGNPSHSMVASRATACVDVDIWEGK